MSLWPSSFLLRVLFFHSFFCGAYDASHGLLCHYLRVGSEAGGAVQMICQVRAGVGGDIAFPGDADEVHVLKGPYYLVHGEAFTSAVDLFSKILVENQGEKTWEEVSLDTVIPP